MLSSNAFPGFPVPIEIKYLTSGFKSPVSKYQMFDASPSLRQLDCLRLAHHPQRSGLQC